MELESLVSLTTIISTLVVGLILNRQIRAQSEVIQSYKAYLELFDIQKLKEFDSYRHESTILKAEVVAKKQISEALEGNLQSKIKPLADQWLKEVDANFQVRFDEVCEVLYDFIIEEIQPEKRAEFIKEFLPNNEHLFLEALKEDQEAGVF